jgi:endonuclease/exonuclease/phosphatase family metal-dependent hydrolase
MICFPHEKNNDNFHQSVSVSFNDCIQDLYLIELTLLDRRFTWTNKRDDPTLERLDRAFINLDWDRVLPSTLLSSMTRRTSDHVPLKIDIATTIPRSNLFRFDNY